MNNITQELLIMKYQEYKLKMGLTD
jgi:hypothetical protein